jgi:hypothetical protein
MKTNIDQSYITEYLSRNDKVKITTNNAAIYKFKIQSIDSTFIEGTGIKVPYSTIKEIEVLQLQPVNTVLFTTGIILGGTLLVGIIDAVIQ